MRILLLATFALLPFVYANSCNYLDSDESDPDKGESTDSYDGKSNTYLVDLVECDKETSFGGTVLQGSFWWIISPKDSTTCEIWLGGETEDPDYDGSPTKYCTFARNGTATIEINSNGGPANISDQSNCVEAVEDIPPVP